MENPITKFNEWWALARQYSPLKQKNAVCVSTIRADGFPSGRFVDLKAMDENGFKFCTHFESNKGLEIARNPKVAMTVWWDHVGLQVRIVGIAEQISVEESIRYWLERSRDSQIATVVSKQSRELDSGLEERIKVATREHEGRSIPKPDNWGGYAVKPVSIEFLTFKDSRLHLRELYRVEAGRWQMELLQP